MTKVAYWYEDGKKERVAEYRGVGQLKIMDGAIVIHDERGEPRLILAPGDWHELVLEDEDE
jgi:hypothetical protein